MGVRVKRPKADPSLKSELILYQTEDGDSVSVRGWDGLVDAGFDC
jgi:hypothetical protein